MTSKCHKHALFLSFLSLTTTITSEKTQLVIAFNIDMIKGLLCSFFFFFLSSLIEEWHGEIYNLDSHTYFNSNDSLIINTPSTVTCGVIINITSSFKGKIQSTSLQWIMVDFMHRFLPQDNIILVKLLSTCHSLFSNQHRF